MVWGWDEPMEDQLFLVWANRETSGSCRPGGHGLSRSAVAPSPMAAGVRTHGAAWQAGSARQAECSQYLGL